MNIYYIQDVRIRYHEIGMVWMFIYIYKRRKGNIPLNWIQYWVIYILIQNILV